MHKFKIISVLFLLIISAYLSVIYGLPAILNTQILNPEIENIIEKKSGIKVDIDGINLSITPGLKTNICLKELSLPSEEKTAASIKNTSASIDLIKFKPQKIAIESVYIQLPAFRKIFSGIKKGTGKKKFNLSKLPDIEIAKTDILLNPQKSEQIKIDSLKLKARKQDIKTLKFNASYNTSQKSKIITTGQQGQFLITNNSVYADDFLIKTPNSELYLDGKMYAEDNSRDLKLRAKNIPADKIFKTLLYYQKLNDKSKKFIENFKNFGGRIDFDLSIKNNDISGRLNAKKLSANSVLFNVPVYFPEADFILDNKTLTSRAEGTLGGEKVLHTLTITNIFSPQRLVKGEVTSTLTEKMIEKYLPDTYHLKNTADAKVIYTIQNKIPEVKYYLKLNKGSDVIYKNAYLGLRNKQRILYARTIKVPNGLKLKEYEYYLLLPSEKQMIIQGNGLFIKQNGKMTPKFITCRTQNYAPVSVTGSFGKYVHGGKFKGDLKYNFITDKITGNFEIVKTIFNDFYVNSAKVDAKTNGVDIIADGHYKHQPFKCRMNIANRLDGFFIVNNMEILIEKFIITRKASKPKHLHHDIYKQREDVIDRIDDVSSRINKIDMTIQKWNIKVNKLFFEDIVLNNIQLFGSLKDSLFDFTMPEVMFADGVLSARGKYDFNDNSSSIDFLAREINSNIAAEKLFNLTNQIQGIARAKLHVKTLNNLQEIFADVDFAMEDGFLPQLGSMEFMLGKANKKRRVSMYDLTNLDFTNVEKLNSDIKGSFRLHNYDLENINITSHQKFMSLYINGNYNMLLQDAEMNIYGKYDQEAPKGIRILFVPLNWILKLVLRPEESMEIYQKELAKIPPIETKQGSCRYFRVKIKGNLNNTDDIQVILKRIK